LFIGFRLAELQLKLPLRVSGRDLGSEVAWTGLDYLARIHPYLGQWAGIVVVRKQSVKQWSETTRNPVFRQRENRVFLLESANPSRFRMRISSNLRDATCY